MVSAIVLAAGSSTRMAGTNKLLLPWNESTVIAHTVQQVMLSGADETIVVTGYQHEAIKMALSSCGAQLVFNPLHASGMTSSIKAGINASIGQSFMICLGDLPMIRFDEYAKLVRITKELMNQDTPFIIIPQFNNERANPVIFSNSFRQAILDHKAPEGCREIVAANQEYVHWVDMETDHVISDIDYTTDYQNLIHGNKTY